MDDLTKILLTSSLTTLGAVVVFVASQALGKLVIEPVHDLKRLLGEIRYRLSDRRFTASHDQSGCLLRQY
jgi:hypothetical protein